MRGVAHSLKAVTRRSAAAAKRSPVVLNAARTLATKAASPSLASSPVLKAAASAASSKRFSPATAPPWPSSARCRLHRWGTSRAVELGQFRCARPSRPAKGISQRPSRAPADPPCLVLQPARTRLRSREPPARSRPSLEPSSTYVNLSRAGLPTWRARRHWVDGSARASLALR